MLLECNGWPTFAVRTAFVVWEDFQFLVGAPVDP